MMSGAKGASAPFGIHDIAFELARKHYIMYPKMARSAFDPYIIIWCRKSNVNIVPAFLYSVVTTYAAVHPWMNCYFTGRYHSRVME